MLILTYIDYNSSLEKITSKLGIFSYVLSWKYSNQHVDYYKLFALLSSISQSAKRKGAHVESIISTLSAYEGCKCRQFCPWKRKISFDESDIRSIVIVSLSKETRFLSMHKFTNTKPNSGTSSIWIKKHFAYRWTHLS